jgi:hypothetical protein
MIVMKQKASMGGRGRSKSHVPGFGETMARLLLKVCDADNICAVYLGPDKIRVHHGEIGTACAIVGNLIKSTDLVDFGRTLMADDAADSDKWFTFRRMEEEVR